MNDPQPAAQTADPDTLTSEMAELEALPEDAPRVGIIMGTKRHLPVMEQAGAVLKEADVGYEVRVMSAHRELQVLVDYCRNARLRGLRVIIAGAGLAAALPGIAAANTDLPVIGVPLTAPGTVSGGLDAVLSVVQMPAEVPVAAVGLDNPANAAYLALRILSA